MHVSVILYCRLCSVHVAYRTRGASNATREAKSSFGHVWQQPLEITRTNTDVCNSGSILARLLSTSASEFSFLSDGTCFDIYVAVCTHSGATTSPNE